VEKPLPEGQITVRVACKDEQLLEVSIEDNGVGFPSDMQKMLEPYVTTRTKGTGLGLAIVKKVVEDHRGTIRLENNNSGGARVTLSFLQHCDINAAV
jgi:two-component system nitrogen regulation sensor histidine kinase NtrY